MSVASSDNSDIDSVELSINTKLLIQVNTVTDQRGRARIDRDRKEARGK